MRNIPLIWILARVFVYAPPFISQILDFIYWTVLIFILIYFEWRDTENQQILHSWCSFRGCNPFVEIWTCKSPAKNTHEPGPAWQRIAGNYRIRGQKKIASRSSLLHGSRFHSVVTQRSSLLHRWRVTFLLDASVSRYRRPLKLRDFVWEIKYWDLRTLNNVTSNFSFNGLTCGERGGGKRKECVPFVY